MNLDKIRKEIDSIDKSLCELINKRMDLSKEVAEYKIENNMPVFDRVRENAILDKVANESEEYADQLKKIYSSIMEQSKSIQYSMIGGNIRDNFVAAPSPDEVKTVACQGVEGAYSHLTALALYKNADVLFYDTWKEVCNAVKKGEAEYGILPVENSWAGSVHEVYDLLINGDFYISLCADARICHNLIGLKGAKKEDITTVLSHPQALAQCSDYLKQNGYVKEQMANTAMAVKKVSEIKDIHNAAIGSKYSAQIYSLDILDSSIASSKNNTTRFVSISNKPQIMEKTDKISVVLSLDNKSGTLYNLLARFASCNMNLTKLESRPTKQKQFEYIFYIDFEGNLHDKKTLGVLTTVESDLPYFKLLGNYPEFNITLE